MRRRRRYWVKVLTFLIVLCVFVCITSFAEVSYIVQFASVRTGARVKTDTSDGSKLSDGGYVWPRAPDAAVPPNSGRRFLGNSGLDEEQYDSLDTGNGTALRHDSSVTTVRPPCAAVTDPPVLATVHKCQPLDVAVVCAGATAVRQVATLIKSILFYRKNPLNFHFLVDTLAKHVLSNLFRTWNLPKVSVEFYDVDKLTPEVAWVPNKHYSGVFGLLKLTLVNALPQNLTKVIVLDTDVIFNVDIAELWSLWFHFNAKQSIGLVENHSDWYLGKLWKNLKVWPALGRGFNTGVILMHLGRLRSYHFPTVWHEIAEKQLGSLFSTSLADQDIINAVIKNDSGIVFELPCIWNLQLGDNSLSEDLCSSHLTDIKVFHWNSPRKQKSYRGRHVGYYRKLYLSFLEFDGNLLRRELYHCAGSAGNGSVVDLPEDQEFEDDECYEFRRHSYIQYRTHLYLLDFHYVEKSDDVTLIAQMSIDRLQMLEQLMQHWEGPASVTVYLSDVEQQQFLNYVQESSILMARRNVAYHVVYKEGVFYPINYLRNVALRQVVTPYVYLTDIDFLPMYGLYEQLRQAIAAQGSMINKALIVPAFETQRYRFDFPKSKTELLTMLDTNMLFIFRHDVWVKGHRATDYDRWPTATTPYTVSWTNDFEPYVVVNKDIPEYDTRFLGFGWNKVSQIMELDAIGYDFIVLPNAFMIHLPHAPSFDIAKYRSSHQYRKCLKLLKGQFIKELAKKYIRTRKVPNNNIGINNTSSNVVR